MTEHRLVACGRWRGRGTGPLIAALLLCACDRQPPAEPRNQAVEANEANVAEPAAAPALPEPLAPLDRKQLIAAARLAADATASGAPPPEQNRELVDRSFGLRLPFGCENAEEGEWAQVSFEESRRVLRLRVSPPLSKEAPLLAQLSVGTPFDAAEGYWLERPWTGSEECPPTMTGSDAAPMTAVRQTLAIVQFFALDAPRTLQRGDRPYSFTRKLAPEESPRGGYRVVLEGRIAAFPDGQPIRCRVEHSSLEPVCAVNARFARIAIERASDGLSLAEWTR